MDPLTPDYPSWSPYPFAMNRPIDGVDLDGLEWVNPTTGQTSEVTHHRIDHPYDEISLLLHEAQNKLIADGFVPSAGNQATIKAQGVQRSPETNRILTGSGYLSQRGEGWYYTDVGLNNRMYLYDPDYEDWRLVYDQWAAEQGRLEAVNALVDNYSLFVSTLSTFGLEGVAVTGVARGGYVSTTAKTSADYVSNVTATSFGKVWGQGTVNVGKTINAIRIGSLKPSGVYNNIEKHAQLFGKPNGYWQKYELLDYGSKTPLRIIKGGNGELFLSPDHYKSLIPLGGL